MQCAVSIYVEQAMAEIVAFAVSLFMLKSLQVVCFLLLFQKDREVEKPRGLRHQAPGNDGRTGEKPADGLSCDVTSSFEPKLLASLLRKPAGACSWAASSIPCDAEARCCCDRHPKLVYNMRLEWRRKLGNRQLPTLARRRMPLPSWCSAGYPVLHLF